MMMSFRLSIKLTDWEVVTNPKNIEDKSHGWLELGKQEAAAGNLDARLVIDAGTSPPHVREPSLVELNPLS
jgi:hypothetical protein